MLTITRDILTRLGNEWIAKIQANIRSKRVTRFGPMNASGRTAASLHYEFGGNDFRLYGAGHIFKLETGLRPGVKVPFSRIRAWIDEKPITVQLTARMDGSPRKHRNGSLITLEDEKNSVAWAIKKSIEQKGTVLFRQGGNSGILADVINEENLRVLYDALFYEFETVVTSELLAA